MRSLQYTVLRTWQRKDGYNAVQETVYVIIVILFRYVTFKQQATPPHTHSQPHCQGVRGPLSVRKRTCVFARVRKVGGEIPGPMRAANNMFNPGRSQRARPSIAVGVGD